MLKVCGISLGSSKRDFCYEIEALNKSIQLSRRGTDGSHQKAKELIAELDGKVDVFCLGGVNLNFVLGNKKYPIKAGQEIAMVAKKTPVVDGERIKAELEIETLRYLQDRGILNFSDKKVLLVSVLDRYPLAKAFEELGARLTIGDALFGLGIPIPFRNLSLFSLIAQLTLPILKNIPFNYLYPVGRKQEENKPRFLKYYKEADIIAGDYHFISRNMPRDLVGKTMITSTVTKENTRVLKERGVKLLVTTSPLFQGRSYGGNILEGLFYVLKDNKENNFKDGEIIKIARNIGWKPRIEYLNA